MQRSFYFERMHVLLILIHKNLKDAVKEITKAIGKLRIFKKVVVQSQSHMKMEENGFSIHNSFEVCSMHLVLERIAIEKQKFLCILLFEITEH